MILNYATKFNGIQLGFKLLFNGLMVFGWDYLKFIKIWWYSNVCEFF